MQGWRFYWLCWSSHFISPSIPLTCQDLSCCCRSTKPTWWIVQLPQRTSMFSHCFPFIHLYTACTLQQGGGLNQERSHSCVIALAHEFVAVSFVELVFLLEIWLSSSLFLYLSHPPSHPQPFLSFFLKVRCIRSLLRLMTRVIWEIHVSYCLFS